MIETEKVSKREERGRTKLGEEEEEHNKGGGEGDNATGESTTVEILIDFRIRIKIPNFAKYPIHFSPKPKFLAC